VHAIPVQGSVELQRAVAPHNALHSAAMGMTVAHIANLNPEM